MTVEIGWPLALALGVLIVGGGAVAVAGRVPVARSIPWAAVRAGVQLLAVTLVVGLALQQVAYAIAFVAVMFLIGAYTTAQRTGLTTWLGRASAALAMLAGALPVLVVIFASGVAPLNGPAIVPIAGILVGNVMSVHTLAGRRAFADLRDGTKEYEAYLSLGYWRSQAIHNVVSPNLHEALIPALDQTRTVGLVTLPGAYIGVLLGGGSPWAAAAAQILVLVGINTAQVSVAVTARWLMSQTWLLPPDLKLRLRP
ncbi:MAG: ABC transporter permease [Tessaracoccus sp.]|uniref:ABC transporter permease n=1 Tax=Tessaracoccus sp. TaxID=1971211 RepID=UPI001ED713B5|nr:ABC transporter permease [Tessaracoccus sp.]MBK7820526.1 ABC transporter permease [Tessaracoccus sp.]